jgi:hypothetical protein
MKPWRQYFQESCMSKSFVHPVTKLFHLKLYNFTVLKKKLHMADSAASVLFYNWFCDAVCDGEVDL